VSNFLSPGWLFAELIVLALAVAYVAWSLVGKQRFAVRYSNVELLDKVARSVRAGDATWCLGCSWWRSH
jgi:hypothetical protein